MSLVTEKTQLRRDLDAKDESVLATAAALNHLASTLSEANRKFWTLPDERLLAVLNHNVGQTVGTFSANTTLGTAVNAQLDAIADDRFPVRAPVTMGRSDVEFDADSGQFVIVAPAEPE